MYLYIVYRFMFWSSVTAVQVMHNFIFSIHTHTHTYYVGLCVFVVLNSQIRCFAFSLFESTGVPYPPTPHLTLVRRYKYYTAAASDSLVCGGNF